METRATEKENKDWKEKSGLREEKDSRGDKKASGKKMIKLLE